MHTRIRELAEQAGVDFFNSIDPEYMRREYCEAWIEQQQKFAELIVRECANRATWAQDTGERDIGGEVLKHFGVKS